MKTTNRPSVLKDGVNYVIPAPFTKLEKFILAHENCSFEDLATQLNRTYRGIERAADMAHCKIRVAKFLGVEVGQGYDR